MTQSQVKIVAASDIDFDLDFVSNHMNGSEALGYLTFVRTYAQNNEKYEDTVNRYLNFFSEKFPKLKKKIRSYGQAILQKKVVGSMRMLQFAGEGVHRENARAFNCSFTGISSVKDFGDVLYLLCCGCGVGISVQEGFIKSLPIISKGKEELIVIPDSKEGWADSIQQLILNCQVEFDYSQIRLAGSPLSTGGNASGPEPLIETHKDIRKILLNKVGQQLSPTDIADIVCLIARCVVAGGVRRSSIIVLFEDDEMLNFKNFPEWWKTHEHRSIANVSRVVQRGTDLVGQTIDAALNSLSGEPGIMLVNSNDITENIGSNPCMPASAKLLTREGIRTLGQVDVGTEIWDGEKFVKIVKKWSTGIKDVYDIRTTKGHFLGTENHKVYCNGEKIDAGSATGIDYVSGFTNDEEIDPLDVLNGVVLGEETAHRQNNNLPILYIGEKDKDYFTSEIFKFIGTKYDHGTFFSVNGCYEWVTKCLTTKLSERSIPEEVFTSLTFKQMKGILRGLFTANGCVYDKRIQYKTSCKKLAIQIQEMLNSLGMPCSLVVNKSKLINWNNDDYTSKESYNLILYGVGERFMKQIGFIQKYKMQSKIKDSQLSKSPSKVVSKQYVSTEEVFDITVDSPEHRFWTSGCLVSNCGEISLKNKSFCNLCEIIMPNCKNEQDFYWACEAAAFFGTLQSSLTDFHYISPEWKKNATEEGLIGISLTGQAMIQRLCTPEILRKGASIAKNKNLEFAKLIDVAPAKRITTTKPSGTTSCVFGTSSGIHAAYSEYCIRRIRISKNSDLGQKFLKLKDYLYNKNKFLLSPDQSKYHFIVDDNTKDNRNLVLQFPVKFENSIYRKDESAIDILNRAKNIYDNWIVPGHTEGQETNNVSLTVFFQPEEKEAVKKWMIENQDSYRGISVLPYDGGTYTLTPFEEVTIDEWKKYEEFFPKIDWEEFTTGIKSIKTTSVACAGGACEINSL